MKLRNIRTAPAILAASLLLCTGAVHAQQTTDQPGAQPSFEFGRLDKNKDGFLSRAEAQGNKNVAALFDRADTNRDGKLSEDELTKARAAQDRENAGAYAGDSAVTTKVKTALLREKNMPSRLISVETKEGVVQLSGALENADQVKRAGLITAKVGGVKSVNNNLTVK